MTRNKSIEESREVVVTMKLLAVTSLDENVFKLPPHLLKRDVWRVLDADDNGVYSLGNAGTVLKTILHSDLHRAQQQ